MASTVQSRKAKGRRLQQHVRDTFRKLFVNELELEDIESRQMGGSGTDVVLTPAAKRLIPFDFECKNQEKLNVNESLKQCEENASPNRIPLLIFTKNRSKIYATIELNNLLKLLYPEKIELLNNEMNNIENNDHLIS